MTQLDLDTIPGTHRPSTPEEAILCLVEQAAAENAEVDRAIGAFVGNALADALGMARVGM